MPAINFKYRFVELISSGRKTQTIRQVRKNPIKTGDKLQLYTGQRTKDCRKICDAICTKIELITIDWNSWNKPKVIIDGIALDQSQISNLAYADGFTGLHGSADFIRFFQENYSLPFYGVIIHFEKVICREVQYE